MNTAEIRSNKTARLAYPGLVAAFGTAVAGFCIWKIAVDAVSYQWLILAYLTILSGAFVLKIPGVNSKLSASDALVFMNMILFGSAAGALTAALDGLLASLRFETPSRRRRATPFNTAAMGISAFLAGEVFFSQLGRKPLTQEPALEAIELVLPLVLSALVFYLCNSGLVAGMIALDAAVDMLLVWRIYFLRISVISWAGAAAGALIAYGIRSITPAALLATVPVFVLIYFVDRIYLGEDSSQPIAADNDPVANRPPYRRYHYFIVVLGLGFIALLLLDVLREKASSEWLILALLTACTGLVSVRIPGIKIKITLADTFVFANIMLFGPIVGGITASLDGLSGSLRCKSRSRRVEFALFNMAAMALAAYISGFIFFRALGAGPLFRAERVALGTTFLPALIMAVSYYVLNTLGVATIVALEQQAGVLRIWREHLLWSILNYVACAMGALLLAAGILAITPAAAIAVILLLACTYTAIRAFADIAHSRAGLPDLRRNVKSLNNKELQDR